MQGAVKRKRIIRIKDGTRNVFDDEVVVEAPLTIFLNRRKLATLFCTPEKKESLILGFLRSGGLLGSLDELIRLELNEEGTSVEVELKEKTDPMEQLLDKRSAIPDSGPGAPFFNAKDGLPSSIAERGFLIRAEEISWLMHSLQEMSLIFKTTGGTHSAALADASRIIIFCEDIGRHNAVDKIIGECLLQNIPMTDKVLVCSGRLSSETLLKAARLQLPLLLSRAAPTTLAIELADALNITVVGFIRGARMNIYTHPHRVKTK